MNLAFHNKPDLAQLVREQVAAHAAADEITQGVYWENGHGCFIGCIAHGNDVNQVEELTGFPIMLTRIAEIIFEALPPEKAKEFLPRMMAAPQVGADLSLVEWKFLHWCVSDALEKYADDDVRVACQPALSVVHDMSIGESVTRAAADTTADALAGFGWTERRRWSGLLAQAAVVTEETDEAVAAYAAARVAYHAALAADCTTHAAWIKQMEKLIEFVGSAD